MTLGPRRGCGTDRGRCIAGAAFGLVQFFRLRNLPVHPSMRSISELIYETCKTYLVTQGKFILLLWVFIGIIAAIYFGKLAATLDKPRYLDRMHQMYLYTKNVHGGNGLFNPEDGLWWRDRDFVPPYTAPNGEDCYWSRGNGWVIAALALVLKEIPEDEPHRKEYIKDLKAMSKALAKVQREDGFWNASLHDPNHYGGKETTGTSLFVFGMAWGINNGILSEKKYGPVVEKAWNALLNDAVHSNGFLGYVQSTGKEPSTGQPLSYDKQPDFEDFGLGCFLLPVRPRRDVARQRPLRLARLRP